MAYFSFLLGIRSQRANVFEVGKSTAELPRRAESLWPLADIRLPATRGSAAGGPGRKFATLRARVGRRRNPFAAVISLPRSPTQLSRGLLAVISRNRPQVPAQVPAQDPAVLGRPIERRRAGARETGGARGDLRWPPVTHGARLRGAFGFGGLIWKFL